jgi:hypothetical protein
VPTEAWTVQHRQRRARTVEPRAPVDAGPTEPRPRRGQRRPRLEDRDEPHGRPVGERERCSETTDRELPGDVRELRERAVERSDGHAVQLEVGDPEPCRTVGEHPADGVPSRVPSPVTAGCSPVTVRRPRPRDRRRRRRAASARPRHARRARTGRARHGRGPGAHERARRAARLAREPLDEPVARDRELGPQQRRAVLLGRTHDGPLHPAAPVDVLRDAAVPDGAARAVDAAGGACAATTAPTSSTGRSRTSAIREGRASSWSSPRSAGLRPVRVADGARQDGMVRASVVTRSRPPSSMPVATPDERPLARDLHPDRRPMCRSAAGSGPGARRASRAHGAPRRAP